MLQRGKEGENVKIRRYRAGDDTCILRACEALKMARDLLRYAACPKAADKTRSALKSAEGAYRHARHRMHRTAANDRVRT